MVAINTLKLHSSWFIGLHETAKLQNPKLSHIDIELAITTMQLVDDIEAKRKSRSK